MTMTIPSPPPHGSDISAYAPAADAYAPAADSSRPPAMPCGPVRPPSSGAMAAAKAGTMPDASGGATGSGRSMPSVTESLRAKVLKDADAIKGAARKRAAGSAGNGPHGAGLRAAARQPLESGRDPASNRMDPVFGAIGSLPDSLCENDPATLARLTASAAEQLQALSNDLRQRSGEELLADMTTLSRRDPALFVAGTLAVGYCLGRFLKASTRDGRSWQGRESAFDGEGAGRRGDGSVERSERGASRADEASAVRRPPPSGDRR